MIRSTTTGAALLLALNNAWAKPEVALEDCFLDGLESPARCGSLAVPLDRHAPDGPGIELHVAVLPALEEPARPDPVFVLAGGPGQSATAIAALARRSLDAVNRERDIVLMDQRGTGQSTPLNCDFDFEELAFDDDAKAAAVARCIDDWEVDPRHFTTPAHIQDLELMRAALGYERINLYGGSYGTRAALVYLRQHPESLRAVVMDAVAPLDMRIGLEMGADAQRALDLLFADCAADPACRERFPDLAGRFERFLDDLATNPVEVTYPHPATMKPMTETLDHRTVALGIRALLYGPQTSRTLPVALDEAINGNFVPLIGLTTAANLDLLEQITPGLMLSVLCAEDVAGASTETLSNDELDSFIGDAQANEFIGFCRAWPEPLTPADWTPPAAEVPVLLLSGGRDPVTPPARAEAAARTLPNSRHVVVANGGHIVAGLGCLPELVAEFIESADPAAVDEACADEIAAPSFFTTLMGPGTGSEVR